LLDFDLFLSRYGEDVKIWGNGASFDNVILANAYRRNDLNIPWKYYNDRCYRTMKSLAPHIKMEREGTHHNALSDAISQANHLIRIMAK
jgi:exodeoxyribonuclease VIII